MTAEPSPGRIADVLAALALSRQGQHRYLSTACLHGEHDYCRSAQGQAGTKTPGTCKFCPAQCVCDCHQEHDRENRVEG